MMASIPNMRSAPLPAPSAKAAPTGDPASGEFAVQLPTVPAKVIVAAQPPLPAGLVDPMRPVLPEATDEESAGTPEKKVAAPDGDAGPPALVIPFVPTLPVPGQPPQASVVVDGNPAKEAVTGTVVGLPCGTIGNGKKGRPAPDDVDLPQQDADTPDLIPAAVTDPVAKALLQRKTLPAKQVAAKAEAEATSSGPADPAPARAQPPQVPAPAAPGALQAAAPLPTTTELPQPALSPAASQPAPAATGKTGAIEDTQTADLAVERKLDLARDGAWLDRLARDIARAASDDAPLRFRLHPQTLGSLHVELQQGDRGTAVRLTVETEAARQILTDAQPRLAAEARAQGVRIAETHVDLSGSGRHAPGDQRRQDEARPTPFIRTAPGAGPDAAAARSSRRARLDRYA